MQTGLQTSRLNVYTGRIEDGDMMNTRTPNKQMIIGNGWINDQTERSENKQLEGQVDR
jgi:hypothetical protein